MTEAARDEIQEFLADYAYRFDSATLSESVLHAAKVRIIDTFGGMFGAIDSEPVRRARRLAGTSFATGGATVFGASHRTSPDLAALANGTAARHLEMNDCYFALQFFGGHPSDVILPVFAACEAADCSGRDLLGAVVLAYEVYCRLADATKTPGFDQTNFVALASAIAAARALLNERAAVMNAIAIAVVSGNALQQARTGHLTSWKSVAAGLAGRSGLFAAMLASEGVVGPTQPFVGTWGWRKCVAKSNFTLSSMGGLNGESYKIGESLIKLHPACGMSTSTILAAEKIKIPPERLTDIEDVLVETFEHARNECASGEHSWNPVDAATADHSIPYCAVTTLMDGSMDFAQFDDAHLWNPKARALMKTVRVVARDDFTAAFTARPSRQRVRMTVTLRTGETLASESGGEQGDLTNPKTDEVIAGKFRRLAAMTLSEAACSEVLDSLWSLDEALSTRRWAAAIGSLASAGARPTQSREIGPELIAQS